MRFFRILTNVKSLLQSEGGIAILIFVKEYTERDGKWLIHSKNGIRRMKEQNRICIFAFRTRMHGGFGLCCIGCLCEAFVSGIGSEELKRQPSAASGMSACSALR